VRPVKTLVLVLAIDKEPWKQIENEGQDKTWKINNPDSITVMRYVSIERKNFFYYFSELLWKVSYPLKQRLQTNLIFSRFEKHWNHFLNNKNPKVFDINGTLVVDLPEAYSLIGLKTIAVFNYILSNYDFDFIYRTNISSYVDLVGLQNFVIRLETENDYYGGTIGHVREFDFASGSGYLISRNTLTRVLENSSKWNHCEIDDVALGIIISESLFMKPESIARKDFKTVSEVNNDTSYFHYRCKHQDPQVTIDIMQKLYRLIRAND